MTRPLSTLLFSLAAAGCSPASDGGDDDVAADADPTGDTRSGFHDVTVAWTLRALDGSVMSACPAGFTTLYVNLYRNPDGLVAPPDAEVTLPCTPQGTLTRPVATAGELPDPANPDAHFPYEAQKDFVVRVTEETLSSIAASTSLYYVEALSSDLSLDFQLYPDGGVGTLAWQLESSLTTAPLASCAAGGVDQIEAAIRPFFDDAAPFVVVGTWGCNDRDPYQYYEPNGNGFAQLDEQFELGSGTTTGLAPGDYKAEIRAKRAGVVVGTAETELTIEARNDANPFKDSVIVINDR